MSAIQVSTPLIKRNRVRLTTLGFLFASFAFADVQNGVVVSGGQPIPGAAVTAVCGEDKISTVTDGDGRFEMGGLPSTPCKFSVAMFGFEVSAKEAKASATALSFDLKLQAKATLPQTDVPVVAAATPASPAPATPETKAAAAAIPTPAPDAPKPSLAAAQAAQQRGGRGGANANARGGRGAQAAGDNGQSAGGFQNLSLLGSAGSSDDVAPGGGFDAGTASAGAGDAM